MTIIMKKLLAIAAVLLSAQYSYAQSEWALHISAEETVTLGDQRSSFNFLSFTQLAANSGMRAGFHYTKDNTLAAEITLGVVGSSRPNTWFTKLVPVEVVGHYNVVPLLLDDSPLKFNVDLGLGSGLVRARSASYNLNGRFGFSEHLSAGLSLDIPVEDVAVLSFGFRNTYFIDDYIDATSIDGTSNDQLLRFFTSARVPLGQSAKSKAKIAEAEDLAASLSQTLESSKLEASENAANASAQIQSLENQVQNMSAELAELKKAPKQQYILQSVLFEINSSEIRSTDVPELTSLQSLLANNTALTATIIGHTDDSGPTAFNEKLSLDRASTVKAWLVEKGIDASRLSIKGVSSTNPIIPDSRESARAVNRRTEIILK